MAFPTLSPRNESPYDHFLALLEGDPIAVTTTGDPIYFDITAAPPATRCIIGSAGYTGYVATTAEWTIELQVSDAIGGTYIPVGSLTIPGAAGNYSFGVSGQGIYRTLSTARYVRAVATLTGAAGAGSFEVYLGA